MTVHGIAHAVDSAPRGARRERGPVGDDRPRGAVLIAIAAGADGTIVRAALTTTDGCQ